MKIFVILAISVLVIAAVFVQPPLAQDSSYHQFADQRGLSLFPNALNVLSNVPYLLIGLAGMRLLFAGLPIRLVASIRGVYVLLFASVFLLGIGSTYYHLAPDNATLFWDRLPMALGFISFFSIVIAEFIDEKAAVILFPWFLFIALSSVIYWYWTESLGQGDLRLYVVVQFLPILLLPIILLWYPGRFNQVRGYWLLLVCYLLAKLFELWDAEVYQLGHFLSGHTLKHLFSAYGLWLFYRMLRTREYR